MGVITLTTDFGLRDWYVGAMKGAILGVAPKAMVVDITHEIGPYDVVHGAFVLRQVVASFPVGTIHVVVVDPGVGSSRRILLGQYAGQYVIAPDNGLLTFLHRDVAVAEMVVVENRRYFSEMASTTFHGRDVMGPVAGHLHNGVRAKEFGRLTDRMEMLAVLHRAEVVGGEIRGEVLYVDRFGTLVTNIGLEQLAAPRVVEREAKVFVGDVAVGGIRAAYHEAAIGEPIALVGSAGYLEIAVNQGRAVDRFEGKPTIRVSFA
ncbi:MAG: SAM-dependent chlorinase/fluorinase [Planctomycetota bacterium]